MKRRLLRRSTTHKRNGFLLSVAMWMILGFLSVAFRFNSITIPLERDEGLFGYIGQVVLNGGMPYRDAVDHKPPLVYFLYALALTVMPPTAAGVHIFLLCYNFLTLIVLYWVARCAGGTPAAGFWTALVFGVFSTSPELEGFAASSEMLMLLPLSLSLLFALLSGRQGMLVPASFASGLFCGLACWTKHTGVFFALVLFCILPAVPRIVRAGTASLAAAAARAAAWVGGFFSISVAVIGYFYARGAGDDFLYWNFIHNYYYGAERTLAEVLPKITGAIASLCRTHPVPAFAVFICVCTALFKRDIRGACFVVLLLASLAATLPGHAYAHYFAQLAPAVALGSGFGCSIICAAVRHGRMRTGVILLVFFGLCCVPPALHIRYYLTGSTDELSKKFFSPNPFAESIDVAAYISRTTTPRDKVFIFGSEAQILLYSRRTSATRFVLLYPLMRSMYPRYREHQQQAWEEVMAVQPTLIVLVNVPQSVLWDGKADPWIHRMLMRYVAERYELVAAIPVDYPRGKMIIHPEPDRIERELAAYRYDIKIYRRRSDA
ncbi:MAG: hypothetical protein N3B18_07360 [Desulfobacterota bacterium]|nr:hypothetical protein [Thermodesulfobacteriota bacterium]